MDNRTSPLTVFRQQIPILRTDATAVRENAEYVTELVAEHLEGQLLQGMFQDMATRLGLIAGVATRLLTFVDMKGDVITTRQKLLADLDEQRKRIKEAKDDLPRQGLILDTSALSGVPLHMDEFKKPKNVSEERATAELVRILTGIDDQRAPLDNKFSAVRNKLLGLADAKWDGEGTQDSWRRVAGEVYEVRDRTHKFFEVTYELEKDLLPLGRPKIPTVNPGQPG